MRLRIKLREVNEEETSKNGGGKGIKKTPMHRCTGVSLKGFTI